VLNFHKSLDILVNKNFVRKIFIIAYIVVFMKCEQTSTEDHLVAQISEHSDGKAWRIIISFVRDGIPHIKGWSPVRDGSTCLPT